jgi:hypothetical protein
MREAITGGGQLSQMEGSYNRWGKQTQVEDSNCRWLLVEESDSRWRTAIAGGRK